MIIDYKLKNYKLFQKNKIKKFIYFIFLWILEILNNLWYIYKFNKKKSIINNIIKFLF